MIDVLIVVICYSTDCFCLFLCVLSSVSFSLKRKAFAFFMSVSSLSLQTAFSFERSLSEANTKRTAENGGGDSRGVLILFLACFEKSERYILIDGASHFVHRSDTKVSRYRPDI